MCQMPESMFVPMCEKLKFQVFKEDGQEGTMMNMGNRRIHPKSNRFHHRRTLYSSASARHERMSCRDATVPGSIQLRNVVCTHFIITSSCPSMSEQEKEVWEEAARITWLGACPTRCCNLMGVGQTS